MRILLIEDNENDVFLLEDALARSGEPDILLECSETLTEGLEVLSGPHPDLLLLDLGLPESDGLDTLARIRAVCPDLPVVVLTGLDDDETALAAISAGAQDFLVKGRLEPANLLRALRYAATRGAQERVRRDLERRLQESLRVEAAGRLAGGLAHGFNGILAIVTACGETLVEGGSLGSSQVVEVERLLEAAGRGKLLTQELLAFAGEQVLEPLELDFGALLLGLEPLLRHVVGRQIQLQVEIVAPHPRVHADPTQLERMVLNLVGNAGDSMPMGGDLSVRIEEALVDSPRFGAAVGSYVVLVVEDSGLGLSPEEVERVFEPDLAAVREGTGARALGLASVFGVTRQSGGFITVESVPQRGSTFRVFLPSRGGEIPPRPRGRLRGAGKESGGLGILLVEDDPDLRFLVARTLRRGGYRVFEAGHGMEALEIVEEEGALPHLLLTDVVMPHLGGVELARRLREEDPELPVIFFSGYSEASLKKSGEVPEGYIFLQKPFLAKDLYELLRLTLSSGGGAGASRE